MKMNSTLLKTIAFLLVGGIIAITFTLAPDSYSSFKRLFKSPEGEVKAASTDDILEIFEVEYNGEQPFIKLKKAEQLDYSPVIYFSVEGDIDEYILHIDPIKLMGDEEYTIPIVPNVNLKQKVKLIFDIRGTTKGQIKVKHLNEFIDETLNVSFSNKYLLYYYREKDFNLNTMNAPYVTEEDKDSLIDYLMDIIDYMGEYVEWQDVKREDFSLQLADNDKYSMPMDKIDISSHQSRIVNQVAPNLLEYNDELYSILEDMIDELNRISDENNRLTEEVEMLKLENEALVAENNGLEVRNSELLDCISRLENTIATTPVQSELTPAPAPTTPILAPESELEPEPESEPEPTTPVGEGEEPLIPKEEPPVEVELPIDEPPIEEGELLDEEPIVSEEQP